jgi:hypothetical protein
MMLCRIISKLVERLTQLLRQNHGLARAEILHPVRYGKDALAEGSQLAVPKLLDRIGLDKLASRLGCAGYREVCDGFAELCPCFCCLPPSFGRLGS